MHERTVQLVLHYDGAAFAGWQRQPHQRTVQGALEETLASLCTRPVPALGAGRTDAGVHARGQAVGVRVSEKWTASSLRRALNGTLPADVWVADAFVMRPEFHARFSALSRRYSYVVGTDDGADSPFRRRWEWHPRHALDRDILDASACALLGDHRFRAFAVRGTAPADDDHRCTVIAAAWRERPCGLVFVVEANRFLHRMVRFLVGTMVEAASGGRAADAVRQLLEAESNEDTSAPAPAHALFLDAVTYPPELYL